jgi:non-heme chloroperoxidase
VPFTGDRHSLFFRDWGAGAPVLFCSSLGLSSCQFQYQMIHLADHGFRVIAYDRRGHGRSDDPGRGYDYDTLADDLATLIEHLDLHDVTLVGHSMAGGEIVRYLTRHGDARVARIALVSATLPFPLKTATNPAGVDASLFAAVTEQWRHDYGQWITDNTAAFFGDGLPGCSVSQPIRDWTIADLLSTSPIARFQCNRAVIETDFRAELREINTPTLIIHGDRDASIPVEISGALQAELIPGSRLIIYENAPHGLYLTHVDQLNADLASFVTEEASVELAR